MSELAENLTANGHAGRRCHVCRTGRGSRRFEVISVAAGDPIVVCPGCRARLGEHATVAAQVAPAPEPATPPLAPAAQSDESTQQAPQRPDRLRAAISQMDGVFSTAMLARQAGLSDQKTLARLQQLERKGEIRRVGKRWSTESPSSELHAAMDRLAARTSNLRVVRERSRVS